MNSEYGTLENLQVTFIMEDYAGFNQNLLAEHGISLLLECRHARGLSTILVDTGQSAENVLKNMHSLGKDPNRVDLVFLSHCHHDHTGGLIGILKAISRDRIPVIAHPDIYRPNFTIKPTFRPAGMSPGNSREAIAGAGGDLVMIREPLPLAPGVVSTGEIEQKVDFEATPNALLLTLRDGRPITDPMADDVSLAVVLPQGLVVVTGCSHAGIISIIRAAIDLTGIDHVSALIGGFHLINASEERIDKTVDALLGMDIGMIYTGHCTGLPAEAKLLQAFGRRFVKAHAGLQVSFT